MIRGLYAAASGMLSGFLRQEQIANNLANINTPGFKQDRTPIRLAGQVGEIRSFENLLNVPYQARPVWLPVGIVGTGNLNDPIATDFSDGDVRTSGNELDFALIGPGFFEMRAQDGSTIYSRAGEFTRDAGGRIVDQNGALLLGDDGPIVVGQGEVTVDPDGTVYSDGGQVGIIRVMQVPVDTPMR